MDKSGILLVNKTAGYTSHDCVAILRKILGIKKIGHTGTLDPMATGLVTLCIGNATKIMDYTDWDLKVYECTMKLGIKTDTEDIWGNIVEEFELPIVSETEARNIIQDFLGSHKQIPPVFSAIKIDGKKLYDYARENRLYEIKEKIKAREIYIHKIDIGNFEFDKDKLENLKFTVYCSKGTYIRSLCRDIGYALGSLGTMTSLRRIRSGLLSLDMSFEIDKLKDMDKDFVMEKIVSSELALEFLDKLVLPVEMAKDFVNGKKISLSKIESQRLSGRVKFYVRCEDSYLENKILKDATKLGRVCDYVLVKYENRLLGIGKWKDKTLVVARVFDAGLQNEDI